jgi:hypothetical protein
MWEQGRSTQQVLFVIGAAKGPRSNVLDFEPAQDESLRTAAVTAAVARRPAHPVTECFGKVGRAHATSGSGYDDGDRVDHPGRSPNELMPRGPARLLPERDGLCD